MDGRTNKKKIGLLAALFAVAVFGPVPVLKANGLASAIPLTAINQLVAGQVPPPPPPPPPGDSGDPGTTGTGTTGTGTTDTGTTGTGDPGTPSGNVNSAPEPASLLTALVGTGMVSFAAWRRRKRNVPTA